MGNPYVKQLFRKADVDVKDVIGKKFDRLVPKEKLPTTQSVLSTNKADPLEIGVNPAFEDGKFLKGYTKETLEDLRLKSKNATAGGADKDALMNASVEEGKQVGIRLNLGSNIPDSPKAVSYTHLTLPTKA